MFGSIETLVSFFSIWYVCVVVGCVMMVWQGSCHVGCARQKSCGAVAEGFAVEKIISAGFCFARTEQSCWNEVFRSLFRRKV
jgi:hypothetical protein